MEVAPVFVHPSMYLNSRPIFFAYPHTSVHMYAGRRDLLAAYLFLHLYIRPIGLDEKESRTVSPTWLPLGRRP